MKKRIVLFILSFILLFSFSGCNSGANTSSPNNELLQMIADLQTQIEQLQSVIDALPPSSDIEQTAKITELETQLKKMQDKYNELYNDYYFWKKTIVSDDLKFTEQSYFEKIYPLCETTMKGVHLLYLRKYIQLSGTIKSLDFSYAAQTVNVTFKYSYPHSSTYNNIINIEIIQCDVVAFLEKHADNKNIIIVGYCDSIKYSYSKPSDLSDPRSAGLTTIIKYATLIEE